MDTARGWTLEFLQELFQVNLVKKIERHKVKREHVVQRNECLPQACRSLIRSHGPVQSSASCEDLGRYNDKDRIRHQNEGLL